MWSNNETRTLQGISDQVPKGRTFFSLIYHDKPAQRYLPGHSPASCIQPYIGCEDPFDILTTAQLQPQAPAQN